MDPKRWEKIAELYQSVQNLDTDQRSAYLAEACGDDEDLLIEVRSLLRQDASAIGVLEQVGDDARLWNPVAEARAEAKLPAAIGPYHVLRLVGEGGMGAVYEAEQEHPRRRVAVKVVKPGWASSEMLRRFEQESQVLGRLQHPGIAQIYEAGVADTGFGSQPYFAMEFIQGRSLLDYAETNRLNTRQRVEVMIKVCDAVQHAHQRGIVHRDIKPGNILVDENGQPKILDFGVARIIDSDARVTRQTDLGELVGTLAYMSPEQVLADPLELDARSDVYSLGVVLYELLAGRLPYEVSRNVHDGARIIREQAPVRLGSVDRAYRGDLDTIAGKALEKDKARRYASAADLAADLTRYVRDEPILARPPSSGYQLKKFATRHKTLVAAALAIFVVMIAGTAVSTREAIRANRAQHAALVERDRALRAEQAATSERNRAVEEARRADTQTAVAQAVSDFLQNDLLAQASARTQSGPSTKPDPDLKVRVALDRAAAQIAGKFGDQPAVEASIRQTIGIAYRDLGLLPEAQQQIERALKLRRQALGPQHPDTLISMNELAHTLQETGKYALAEALFNKVLATQIRARGSDHPDTLTTMNNLAIMVVRGHGDHSRAVALFTKVLEADRRVLGEEHSDTLAVMNNLAAEYLNQGKFVQAEQLYEKVVRIKRRVLGDEHPSTLMSMGGLGVLYRDQGKFDQAEALLKTALNARRRTLGDQHPDTLASLNSLGLVYQAKGKYELAEPLLLQAVEGRSRVLGEESPDTLRTRNNLAELYRREGKQSEAVTLFTKILDARRRVLGPDHPGTAEVSAALGEMNLEQHNYAEAEALLRDALRVEDKARPDDWRTYQTRSLLGACITGLGRFAEAEPLEISGYQGLMKYENSIPAEKRQILDEARRSIQDLYQRWGKPAKAVAARGGVSPR